MNKISIIPVADKPLIGQKTKRNTRKGKYFFVGMAILFPVIVFLGFFPSIQSMNQGRLEIAWLTHIHSIVMTTWILLFLTQSILAATGNIKIHRKLGLLSVVLAICVFIVMLLVSFNIIIANHAPEGSFLFDLLVVDFFEILCFVLFFTWGMLLRKKRPSAHKRLLTLATIVLLTAAVDRIQRINSFPTLGLEYPAFSFLYLNILLIPIFLYDLFTLKKIHKITILGTVIVILLQIIATNVYGLPSWHKFWFEQTSPFMAKVVETKLSNGEVVPLLGEYESTIENVFYRIIISRSNGKLYIQFNGSDKQELGATSETELFIKGETLNLYFVKGSDGEVVSAKAKQIGRIYKLNKVK